MRLLFNRAAVALMAVIAAAGVLAGERAAAAVDDFSAIPGSARLTTDVDMGGFSSSNMTVDVVLAPSNESELSGLLASVYDPKSQSYHRWLGQGEFNMRFAPSSAQVAAVTDYLRESGLDVEESSSPFLLRVKRTQQHGRGDFQDFVPHLPKSARASLIFQTPQRSSSRKPGLRGSSVSWVFRIPCACNRTVRPRNTHEAGFPPDSRAVKLHTRPSAVIRAGQ